jgi:lipopolysaccharide export system protein LptA
LGWHFEHLHCLNECLISGFGRFRLAASLGLLLLFASKGLAATQEGIVVRDFRVSPEFYPPPNGRQMKFLLEGETARPVSDGRYIVTKAKLQNFRQDGKLEMLVETPECYYTEKARSIDSPGALKVQTGEGGFLIEGEGFLWRQTNSTLLISNRVHTVVQPELFSSGSNVPASNLGPVEIRAGSFEYGADAGLGVYRGGVQVTGTNLSLAGDQLSVILPLRERQIRTITAERNVSIDYGGITATGDKAVYFAQSDLLQLTGNPKWQAQQREGGAETLMIDRTNRIFQAQGNAYLRMSGENATSGFPSFTNPERPKAISRAEQFVEVRSSSYEVRTNAAVFNENVRLKRLEGENLRGEMSCDTMQLAFAGTNELQTVLAEGNVVIQETTNRFTARKALYRAAEHDLTLTGQPAWEAGTRQGKGDTIRVETARNLLTVEGDAYMKLPAGELGGTSVLAKQKTQPVATGLVATTNRFAEVFSQRYELSVSNVLFSGDVRILHPQINWRCERILVFLSGKSGMADKILAEPKVNFDAVNEKGQKITGKGDVAIYTRTVTGGVTNEFVELTGHPATLQATNGLTIHNRVLVMDLTSGKFVVPPGRYHILGPTNAVDTELIKMPDSMSFLPKGRKKSK